MRFKMNTNANVNVEEMEAFKELIENCAVLGGYEWERKMLSFDFTWCVDVRELESLNKGEYINELIDGSDMQHLKKALDYCLRELSYLDRCAGYNMEKAKKDAALIGEYTSGVEDLMINWINRGFVTLMRNLKKLNVDAYDEVNKIVSKYGYEIHVELF